MVQETTNDVNGAAAYASTPFEALACPSDMSVWSWKVPAPTTIARKRGWAVTSYMANWHAFAAMSGAGTPGRANRAQAMARPFGGISDGLSRTILFGEGMNQCDGAFRLAFWSDYRYLHGQNFGITWDGKQNTLFFQPAPKIENCNNWRAQALHEGSMNVCMGDASVQRLNKAMSRLEAPNLITDNPTMVGALGVWDRLMRANDGQN